MSRIAARGYAAQPPQHTYDWPQQTMRSSVSAQQLTDLIEAATRDKAAPTKDLSSAEVSSSAARAARESAAKASALAAEAVKQASAANKRADAAAAKLRRAERLSKSKPQPTQRAPWRSPVAMLALAALCGPLALWAYAFVLP